MKTFYRFCSKYRTPAKILLGLFLCGAYSLFLWWLHAPIWLHPILWLLLIFINHVAVDSFRNKLLVPAIQQMDDACDPYPLLGELDVQASYPASESMRQIYLINRATALRNIGEFETALTLLVGSTSTRVLRRSLRSSLFITTIWPTFTICWDISTRRTSGTRKHSRSGAICPRTSKSSSFR